MNKTPRGKDGALMEARRELARLRQQAEQARVALAQLHREVAEAENRLDGDQSARLIEANE
jgi:hypothetical protein